MITRILSMSLLSLVIVKLMGGAREAGAMAASLTCILTVIFWYKAEHPTEP